MIVNRAIYTHHPRTSDLFISIYITSKNRFIVSLMIFTVIPMSNLVGHKCCGTSVIHDPVALPTNHDSNQSFIVIPASQTPFHTPNFWSYVNLVNTKIKHHLQNCESNDAYGKTPNSESFVKHHDSFKKLLQLLHHILYRAYYRCNNMFKTRILFSYSINKSKTEIMYETTHCWKLLALVGWIKKIIHVVEIFFRFLCFFFK